MQCVLQVRPFSELPQRPINGMLNFWQTQEGLHAIATDPKLQPPPLTANSPLDAADTDLDEASEPSLQV